MMKIRAGWLMTLGLVATGVAACGGGASMPAAPSVSSGSFSPTTGTTASGGAAPEVWWNHRLNGAMPSAITVSGTPGSLVYGDRLTKISDGGTKRVVTFNFTLTLFDPSGNVTSQATNEVDDTLMAGPPNALVAEQLNQTQQISGQGMTASEMLSVMVKPATPQLDLGDRTDLDQLPVGHVDEQTLQTTASANVTVTAGGSPMTSSSTVTTNDHVVATVMQQIASMTVLGNTYERVVELLVTTDSTDTSTMKVTTTTQTLWLAAGIGTIKAKESNALPGPVTAELIDTNLGLK